MSIVDIRKRWGADLLLLVCLAGLVGVEVLGWRIAHRSEQELETAAASGSAEEKVWALHILLHRNEPPRLQDSLVEELLASDEPLVRELAMTNTVRNRTGRRIQRKYLRQDPESGEFLRGRYYMKRFGRPIKRSFVRNYFRSLDD